VFAKIFLPMTKFHALIMENLQGESVAFSEYKDRLCLVVNVASR